MASYPRLIERPEEEARRRKFGLLAQKWACDRYGIPYKARRLGAPDGGLDATIVARLTGELYTFDVKHTEVQSGQLMVPQKYIDEGGAHCQVYLLVVGDPYTFRVACWDWGKHLFLDSHRVSESRKGRPLPAPAFAVPCHKAQDESSFIHTFKVTDPRNALAMQA